MSLWVFVCRFSPFPVFKPQFALAEFEGISSGCLCSRDGTENLGEGQIGGGVREKKKY